MTSAPCPGGLKVAFHRYKDMEDGDREVVRAFFEVIRESDGAVTDHDGNPIEDIDEFLSFSEKAPDLCG